jgi:hypothetical protein
MSDLFKLKDKMMTALFRLVIKHPQIMKLNVFLKAMAVFP